jgi:hypothetical protein
LPVLRWLQVGAATAGVGMALTLVPGTAAADDAGTSTPGSSSVNAGPSSHAKPQSAQTQIADLQTTGSAGTGSAKSRSGRVPSPAVATHKSADLRPRAATSVPNITGKSRSGGDRQVANPPTKASTRPSTVFTAFSDPLARDSVGESAYVATSIGATPPVWSAAVAAAPGGPKAVAVSSSARSAAPVLATPAQVVRAVGIRVAQVLDQTADWLSGLPANPVTDFLSGALLLVRRTLVPGVPNIPSVRVANTWAVEGGPGAKTEAVFTVSLGRAYDTPITLSYATTAPSPLGFVRNLLEGDLVDAATPGQDFTAQSGTLTFAPGQTSQQVSIPVLGDAVIERDEIFGLTVYAEVPAGSPAQAASGKSGDTTRSAAATGVTLINLASADAEIKQGQEFKIQNLTRFPMKYDGPTNYGLSPDSILNVGQTALVWLPNDRTNEVAFKYLSVVSVDNPVPATYYVSLLVRVTEIRGGNAIDQLFGLASALDRTEKTTDIRWETKPFNYDPRACGVGREGDCGYSRSTTVALWDSPATKVTVGAEDRNRQASLLSLCDESGPGSCSFAVNRDGNNQPIAGIPGWGLTHLVYRQPQNTSTSPSPSTFTVTDSTTQGTSWSLSASLKPKLYLDKIIDATISGSYGGSSSSTHTFSQSTTLTVQAGETGYIFATSPVVRYTGTWTVILGKPQNGQGTTYTLTDTIIDRLDTSTGAKFLLYTCKTGSDSCQTADSGKVPADLPINTTPLPGTTQGAGRETQTT